MFLARPVMSSHLMPAETKNEFVMKMIEPITVTGIRFSHSTPLKRYCLHHEWKAQRFKYRDNVEDIFETVECCAVKFLIDIVKL